jgi:STAM-binding protein
MRYAILVSDRINTHPSAKDPENKARLRAAARTIPDVVGRLELLKPRINARYNSWQKAIERRREANVALGEERSDDQSGMDMAASDPAVAGNTTTLAAAENSDLAVKLAHNEIRRRETKRRATRQAGVSEQEEQERRTAGLWDDWEAALSRNGQPRDDDEMRRNMEDTRRRMDGPHNVIPDGVRRGVERPPRPARLPIRTGSSEYRYPSIPQSQPLKYDGGFESQSKSIHPERPHLPPKERFEEEYDGPPIPPDKITSESQEDMSPFKAPQSFTFQPSAYLENGNPLRTVFLPPTLREKFLEIAAPNTRNNLETCGMLCGTLISNALFVSKVIIPEQESTSDTCETVNESAFFDYCAAEDLMVLGWIHTHPTQTCFMSSRDLHTHCGYQIMMPESIAIVCAPSKSPS